MTTSNTMIITVIANDPDFTWLRDSGDPMFEIHDKNTGKGLGGGAIECLGWAIMGLIEDHGYHDFIFQVRPTHCRVCGVAIPIDGPPYVDTCSLGCVLKKIVSTL